MEEALKKLSKQAESDTASIKTTADYDAIYLKYLGKSGLYTTTVKQLKDVPKEDKPRLGALANQIKQNLERLFEESKKHLTSASLDEWIDVTVPGDRPPQGHVHLVTQAISEITKIFERIGFTRVRYKEVEWDWFSFGSLNFPQNHPARDDVETFVMDAPPSAKYGRMILSPHTSSGQVREMWRIGTPPIRMINIAKTYRPNWDVTHTPMFHQFEGLVVDKGINITHLKGTLDYFAKEFFGKHSKARIRPFHFQFTEPSFEVDITCEVCSGKGCRFCKEGWLELGGAGMVHPNVLRAGNIDPNEYTGFAFGWGVERSVSMKPGLKLGDNRIMYGNDIRFLEQF